MALLLPPFPNVQVLIVDCLEQVLPGSVTVVTRTPVNLQELVEDGGLVRVQRVGGDDDGITDTPRVVVDVYGADYDTTWTLAEQVREELRASVGKVDNFRTEVGPHEIPYTDPTLRLISAVYRVSVRRPRQ